MPGCADVPVLARDRLLRAPIASPFLLSAAPPTDGYEQMKKALRGGLGGGIMKTAFDGLHIHIPADYMHAFDRDTYGNCDNVSDHTLDRVCREIGRLVREYPDRLIGGSTGGPVTGNDAADRKGWQSNSRKLEQRRRDGRRVQPVLPAGRRRHRGRDRLAERGAHREDHRLDHGDERSERAQALQAHRRRDLGRGDPARGQAGARPPPGQEGGRDARQQLPDAVLPARARSRKWDEGIVVGMSGAGVAPISNLTLASVGHLGVTVSGNGGPMDYRAAAHFLALGARTRPVLHRGDEVRRRHRRTNCTPGSAT
jgi:hypothetical protein